MIGELLQGRTRTVGDTIEKAWALRAEVGVSRIADITDLDKIGIPVFNSYRPLAARSSLTVRCGKGLSREAALASALMEAVEAHFGEQPEHDQRSCWLTVEQARRQGSPVVTPEQLNLDFGRPYDAARPLEWVPAQRVGFSDQPSLLPANAVFTPYRNLADRFIAGNSDGLAAGNDVAEATLHALLELAERDARAFGEVLKLGSRLDPASVPPQARELIARFTEIGVDVALFWLQSPIRITTIYALGIDQQARNSMLVNGGAGAAVGPEQALTRALLELAQSRLSVISGSREDFSRRFGDQRDEGYPAAEQRARGWAASFETRHYETILEATPEPGAALGIEDQLADVVERFSAAGLPEIHVVELTPPGSSVSVVRAVVPGIEFVAEQRSRVGPRFYRAAKRAGLC